MPFKRPGLPARQAHYSSRVRKAEDRILPGDSPASSIPTAFPLLTPFQHSACLFAVPSC